MALKAVLFDLDDTLYGDFNTCDRMAFAACAAYIEETFGVPQEKALEEILASKKRLHDRLPDEPEIHDRTLYMSGALEALGLNAIDHAEQLHDLYWKTILEHMERREGVLELLDALRERGVKVLCCTNMLAGIQMRKLRLLGLSERVDYLVTSEEAGRDKPCAPIFELALQKAGCAPTEALMVGDNFRHDLVGANAVGIPGLWLHAHPEAAADPDAGFSYLEAPDFPSAAAMILHLTGENTDEAF